jgi:hypothetical protein
MDGGEVIQKKGTVASSVFCAVRENVHIRSIGQGEARHRKYKRLQLCGGQAYYRSSD